MGELKPGWRRVKFGDVVRQIKDKAEPATCGLERFVAGEHMDTDDLRIRRWGNIDEIDLGPAFHRHFRPGQVLYGSRRTYLRKVAVADFEGICANTTYVLESADPKALLPELLPFIMQTEAFHEHSRRESKGSVNPYVNFSDLAWYEFVLPPLGEQRRIAAILTAANNATSAFDDGRESAAHLRMSRLISAFGSDLFRSGPGKWLVSRQQDATGVGTWVPLRAVVQDIIDYRGKTPPYTDSGVPVVSQEDVQEEGLMPTTKWVSEETAARWTHRGAPAAGDVVFRMERFPGAVAQLPSDRVILTRGVFGIRPRPAVVSKAYLYWYLYWLKRGDFWSIHAHATTVPRLYKPEVLGAPVMVLPLADQAELVADMNAIVQAEEGLDAQITRSRSLYRRLCNNWLGAGQ